MPNLERPVFKERNFINSLILLILKLEVFLIPIIFLPFTFEIFEFSKQNVLWLFTFSAVILWLINVIFVEKKIIYRRTPLDIPIIIFLIIWGLSAIFSVDVFSSWFGYYGRFSDAYLSTLCFGLLYFLIVNVLNKQQIAKFFNVFLASVFIILITSILSISGLLSWMINFNLVSSNNFNLLSGSIESLALFSAVILVFITALYSYNIKDTKKKWVLNIKYYLLFALSLINLLLINFPLSWVVLIFGLGAIFCFGLYIVYVNREEVDSVIEISIGPALSFFIISILALFLFSGQNGINLSQTIFKNNLSHEVTLPAQYNKEVIKESFKENPLFGSGPGTFAYDFSLHRPANFNNEQLWQLRFDKAPAYLLELVATVGILGTLSYLVVIGIFLFVVFVFLKNMFRTGSEESYLAFAFSFATFALFITQLLYLNNTALQFTFWLFLSLAIASWRFTYSKIFSDKIIDFKSYKDVMPIFSSIAVVLIGLFIYFSFLQARYYLADIYYNNFRLSGNRENLITAVKLNSNRLNYRIALARDYVSEVQTEINILSVAGSQGSVDSIAKEKLQLNISKAIQAGELGLEIAPNSVMAWETLGVIYRDVKAIAVGSLKPAIEYFEKANKLEPTNPVILTELGKLYLLDNQTNEAVNTFEMAINLKQNYYDAHIGLAKTYDKLGQADKAIITLEEVILKTKNPDIVYESGRLYYNQEDIDKAIERFKQAIELRPSYANAIYSLGLAYQKKGDNINALKQFEKLLQLDPSNKTVQEIIKKLTGEEEIVVEE